MDFSTLMTEKDVQCSTDIAVDSVEGLPGEEFELGVVDEGGCPVDLSELGDDGSGGPGGGTGGGSGGWNFGLKDGQTAWYIAKPAYWTDHDKIESPARAGDLQDGKFVVRLPNERVRPGVYLSEFTIRDENKKVLYRQKRYLDVQPTVEFVSHGPPTVADIRLALMDFPCENRLLETYQYDKATIMAAMRRPVDYWNELPPPIGRYTVASFPWRENWLRATIGNLFIASAALQRRNELTFQASSVTLRDNDKHATYQQLGFTLLEEYKQWCMLIKKSINLSQGIVTMSSPYKYRRRRVWGIGY